MKDRNNAVYSLRTDGQRRIRPRNEQLVMCAGNPLCEGYPNRLKEGWLRENRYPGSHEELGVCGVKGNERAKAFLIKRFRNLQGEVSVHTAQNWS
jgi:hypothetical protein